MNTSSLIVIVCVAVPAVIAITVCVVIIYSRRSKTRKFPRQENSDSSFNSQECRPQDDYPRIYPYRQQRRLHEPSPVFEQSPPVYNPQARRQPLPSFSPVHLTPISLTPSVHPASPPSYDQLFSTSHRLTDG